VEGGDGVLGFEFCNGGAMEKWETNPLLVA